ncbi:hypothetical protein LAUMK13_05763 [Mycobacterium innocens]|uniref:Uncharacterized protein n=1 Tax=Mycobacterium innocens TaxID=2341083 RepID=A0A498QLR2_9MYCO|nr:hypothetical protein LAUMK13_05763 [Mycobacterium innocens]
MKPGMLQSLEGAGGRVCGWLASLTGLRCCASLIVHMAASLSVMLVGV